MAALEMRFSRLILSILVTFVVVQSTSGSSQDEEQCSNKWTSDKKQDDSASVCESTGYSPVEQQECGERGGITLGGVPGTSEEAETNGEMEFGADESDMVRLTLGDSTAAIHLFGATVLSWKAGPRNEEQLFVSKTAVFDNKKAIRGGIPFVFPNFGPWPLGPQHGFARTSMWSLQKREPHKAVFQLSETEESLRMWPCSFKLVYTVELAPNALNMKVSVQNTDKATWDFTLLLHTYLRVANITDTKVRGLDKVIYTDKINKGTRTTQEGDVMITGPTDRVYDNTGNVEVIDGVRTMVVEKNGLPDTVVWNPWVEGCASMGDLDNDAWEKMICVEAGKVADRVILEAGGVYNAESSLRMLQN